MYIDNRYYGFTGISQSEGNILMASRSTSQNESILGTLGTPGVWVGIESLEFPPYFWAFNKFQLLLGAIWHLIFHLIFAIANTIPIFHIQQKI